MQNFEVYIYVCTKLLVRGVYGGVQLSPLRSRGAQGGGALHQDSSTVCILETSINTFFFFQASLFYFCVFVLFCFVQTGDHHCHDTREVGRRDEGLEVEKLREGHRFGGEHS